jgi:hypothetical protein
MDATVKIKFSKYEDSITIKRTTSVGSLIKHICTLHGLDYKYYGLKLKHSHEMINPTLPIYAFNNSDLVLKERFLCGY